MGTQIYWTPKMGEEYFCFTFSPEAISVRVWTDSPENKAHLFYHNCFKTYEEVIPVRTGIMKVLNEANKTA